MKFAFNGETYIHLLINSNGLEYWMFCASVINSDGDQFQREFSFRKETLSFFENIERPKAYRATKYDYDLLLSFEEGREMIDQMKLFTTELQKFKNSEDLNLTILNEGKCL